ncbi:uncharacterized protein LOC135499465 [Lineus longissimus]|uniref:uncharacterized protein LOC135499465 n=1 Tax=Lineus longissimus TaxID=88925 RepID=UPI002B4C887F
MADDDQKVEKKATTNCQNEAIRGVIEGSDDTKDSSYHAAFDGQENNLENFIVGHYQRQKNENPGDNIGEDRINQFFERALAESHRMNAEANKSKGKQKKLHDELGPEVFEAWTDEHAAEVIHS